MCNKKNRETESDNDVQKTLFLFKGLSRLKKIKKYSRLAGFRQLLPPIEETALTDKGDFDGETEVRLL